MTAMPERMAHVPVVVRVLDPLARRLLALGVPMGPNTILTVPGRKTGRPRRFAVAVAELDGHRWVVGAFGEVNWVRNLRSAGTATIRWTGRDVRVAARELPKPEAVAFYREVLPVYITRLPRLVRIFVALFLRVAAAEILDDPAIAARTRPVFELRETTGHT